VKSFFAFRRYLKGKGIILFFGIIAGAIAGVASGFGVPYYIQVVFKGVFESDPSEYTLTGITLIALQLPAVFLLRGISGYFNQYWMNHCGFHVLRCIRQDLFGKLQRLPMAYFDRHKSGDLLSRILADTTLLQITLQETANDLFRQPIQVAVAIGYLVFLSMRQQDSAMLIVFLCAGPIAMLPVAYIGKHLKKRGRQMQQSQGELTEALSENLDATQEVRSFNLEEPQQTHFGNFLTKLFKFQMKVVKYERASQPLTEFLSTVLIAITFVYCYQKQIGLGVFMSLAGALYMSFDPLKRIFRIYGNIQKTQGAIERIQEILDHEETISNRPDAREEIPSKGDIHFENVSFAYREDMPVLTEVSATIHAGETIALVGPSGAGKSTAAKLIPRFYEVSKGSVKIDGIDVRDYRIEALRRGIAVVSQQTVLFNDTLYNNILLGRPDATEEEVYEAARNAFAHDFISSMDEGYQTLAGERGDRLSGGQKQRIAIARAFLRNAPILILDEATSALDAQSEEKIQKALSRLVQGKTVLVIAHRFSTIRMADRIFVFNHGRLDATGTHDELYASSEVYRDLYDKQS